MNINKLLNFSCEMGKQLLQNGAEIYRVEDSVEHILGAYGFQDVEVFAIPACIIITIQDGENNYTKSVRMKTSVNNMHRLNKLNDLCRKICREMPEIEDAYMQLKAVMDRPLYPRSVSFLAYGFGALFFTLFWGGNLLDALISFVCGLAVKLTVSYMRTVRANGFFTNLIASMFLACIPVVLVRMGMKINVDLIIIGAIMLLVPGIAITNVMRDILAGDFVTALSKFAEVLIVAMGIAIGIAVPITGIKTLLSFI